MKKLVIDKEHPNGIVVEVEDTFESIPYEQRVVSRIHEKYSLDDEISMLWKDPNDPEVVIYRQFVEKIKLEERGAV